jgi:predicted methyltransferase
MAFPHAYSTGVQVYLYFTAQNVESDELFESNKTQMSIFSNSSRRFLPVAAPDHHMYKLLPVPYPPR